MTLTINIPVVVVKVVVVVVVIGRCRFQQGFFLNHTMMVEGAQWLSGRVLDSRPKGSGFEPHRRHCVVVLEQDTFILA